MANDGVYHDIVPGRRVVLASTMSLDGRRFSTSLVTAEFFGNGQGARLILTHQGAFFESSDGPAMRKGGWEKLIDQLAAELAR